MRLSKNCTHLPAVRGIQATREYYVTMIAVKQLMRLNWLPVSDKLDPRARAQRILNKARIPSLRDYILNNPVDYVFPAVTLTVDSLVEFQPISANPMAYNIGYLSIPKSARFAINDGQHRIAGMIAAARIKPELENETISAVVLIDTGLRRAQRVFVDINRYALRPTRSLAVLYDYRDPVASVVRNVTDSIPSMARLVDYERATVPKHSSALFTLSSLYRANQILLEHSPPGDWNRVATQFWQAVVNNIVDWGLVSIGELSAEQVRREYVHGCALGLVGIARAGKSLLDTEPLDWQGRLAGLGAIDWRRANTALWEGRATVGGRIASSRINEVLVGNKIKMLLGLSLDEEEETIESRFLQGRVLVNSGVIMNAEQVR